MPEAITLASPLVVLEVRKGFVAVFSNPRRAYWRCKILLETGDRIPVEVLDRNDDGTVDVRWWRTATTYWFATIPANRVCVLLGEASPGKGTGSFRASTRGALEIAGVEAYDSEAAERYVRESISDLNDFLDYEEIELLPGSELVRDVTLSVAPRADIETLLVDGEEGDPHGTMAHATFDVRVPVVVEFTVSAPQGAGPEAIVAAAKRHLAGAAITLEGVAIGSKGTRKLSLNQPLIIRAVQ